ncbi:hypothetical protein SAMN05216344_10350 [Polaromonas sp. OV174]|uniref:hypothetical protein n=1 Tax=Polaromonas sp. OV174 TaxID=1855300 RepID=UPI0008F22A1A|nr:hypothetical protein [Polaromonas sp. OV174]SFB77858.1 hypothetical protein SAMN05216344_10350 [Polaromonas sp. OV174]
MTKKPHAVDRERQRRPLVSIALRIGGLIGTVIFGGRFVASYGSGVTDVDTAVAALANAETETDAAARFFLERLDHTVGGQHSTAHDSGLPGAFIVACGM